MKQARHRFVLGMRMGLLAGRVDGDVLVVRDAAPTLRRRYVVHRRSLDIFQ